MAPLLLRILDNDGMQSLGLLLLDVDGLYVAVQLLLGTLLIVTFPADPHTQAVGDALDATLPHLLVQLRVEADIFRALREVVLV